MNVGNDCNWLAEETVDELTVPFFDTPDNEAREILVGLKAPIVIVQGDFAETVRFCMVARDMDMLQAARFVSQSFACLEALYRQSNVHSIWVDKAARFTDWIDEVAGWLGLQPSSWESARQQMLAEYAAFPTVESALHALVQSADPTAPAWAELPSANHPLLVSLGASYRAGAIDAVFWPWECLLDASLGAVPLAGPIDLTGPSRVLTFGPFMHLPQGRWIARYQFDVDDHPVDNQLEFDVMCGSDRVVSGRASIDSGGRFAFDCVFDTAEPRLPVESRAILAEGSIGGYFTPIGVWLRRHQ